MSQTDLLRKFLFRFMLVLGVISLLEGAHGYMVGNNPNRRLETLDSQGKYVLEWEVDHGAKRVTFNVTVATRGYVGFGLSDEGKMSGADIVIGGVLPNGKSYFSDRHAIGNHLPEIDQSQDWDLHEARENRTHTFLSFSRAFDTCDPQDYALELDKVSLIWAYGENDDNLEYHYRARGEFQVHLLNPDYTPPIPRDPHTNFPLNFRNNYGENVKIWSWKVSYAMTTDHTTYWCTMNKGPVLSGKHHLIGFEMRFNDEVSRRHVHHIQINRCHSPQGFTARSMFHPFLSHPGQHCTAEGGRSQNIPLSSGPIPFVYCSDALPGSAVGNRIHFLPPHVGNPFGESPDEYFMIQVHYDNPEQRPGLNIDVHLDIFYTPQLRKHEGGLLGIRHESPGMPGSRLIPPSSINHRDIAICGTDCLERNIPEEGIRIHSLFLHAHHSGVGIRLRHFRGDVELPFLAAEDNFSFNFQQMRTLPEEVLVLPGDQIMIECTTDTTWTNGTVVEGFSTRQEMCVAAIMYYNKMPNITLCSSETDSQEFVRSFFGIQNASWSNQELEYVVGAPRKYAGLTVTQVSNMIDWTVDKREYLQRFKLTQRHLNRCPLHLYARQHGRGPNGVPVYLGIENRLPELIPVPTPDVPYSRPKSCAIKHNERGRDGNRKSAWEDNVPGKRRRG